MLQVLPAGVNSSWDMSGAGGGPIKRDRLWFFVNVRKYQTINPVPVYPAAAAQPGANGDVGAKAVKRYRTDTVKPVETTQTSSGTAGAGMSATPH